MGKFNGKISPEFTPPKPWVLNRALSFQTDELTESEIECLKEVGANINESGKVTCKKGMVTDLASVPRIVWNIIAPWDVARAAVIHDHLYAVLRKYYHSEGMDEEKWVRARALSDKVFLLGMNSAEPAIWGFKKHSAYWSVRLFGWGPASADE